MATTTPNIGLTLPSGTEQITRQILNDDFTLIDTAVGTLNSNSAEKKFDLFYAFSESEGQGDITDALLINTSNVKGNYNRVGKIRATTTNKPSDCQFGIRQVLAFSTNHFFLIIVGVDTTPKMGIWVNFYNTGNWEGWKRVTIT